MRLFDFSLHVKGFKINSALEHLSNVREKNLADFKNYVNSHKNEIVSYHLKNNPFYKSFGKDINLSNWNTVPIISKKELQQPLQNLLSNNFTKNDLYIGKTSGSSGDPFVFAKDKFCHALTWAQIYNRFSWYGIDFNTDKQARFYGIPLDKKGYYLERLKDFLGKRHRFSVFDLSDEAFEKCLQKFLKTDFKYINGYTSPIVQFAKFLATKNIVLKDVCPSLTVCITTSEMLFEDDRLLLENQFGITVVNEYGASELDIIAFENTHKQWQVNSETLFVEIIDANNNPVEYGKEGRIVITALHNKAFPLIRYAIGDTGILSKQSTLKKPILQKLVGRTDDVIYLPSGKKAAGLTFYYITKSFISDICNIKEFTIEQTQLDLFTINYVASRELTENQKNTIRKKIGTYLEPDLNVKFVKHINLGRTNNGKLMQFKSHVAL